MTQPIIKSEKGLFEVLIQAIRTHDGVYLPFSAVQILLNMLMNLLSMNENQDYLDYIREQEE